MSALLKHVATLPWEIPNTSSTVTGLIGPFLRFVMNTVSATHTLIWHWRYNIHSSIGCSWMLFTLLSAYFESLCIIFVITAYFLKSARISELVLMSLEHFAICLRRILIVVVLRCISTTGNLVAEYLQQLGALLQYSRAILRLDLTVQLQSNTLFPSV